MRVIARADSKGRSPGKFHEITVCLAARGYEVRTTYRTTECGYEREEVALLERLEDVRRYLDRLQPPGGIEKFSPLTFPPLREDESKDQEEATTIKVAFQHLLIDLRKQLAEADLSV